MVMFKPSQSHSGGVIVKPYMQAILRKNCNFLLERKKTKPILRLGSLWQPSYNYYKSQIVFDFRVSLGLQVFFAVPVLNRREDLS